MAGLYTKRVKFVVNGQEYSVRATIYVGSANVPLYTYQSFSKNEYTVQDVIDYVNTILEDDIMWAIAPVITDNLDSEYSENDMLNVIFPQQSGQHIVIDGYVNYRKNNNLDVFDENGQKLFTLPKQSSSASIAVGPFLNMGDAPSLSQRDIYIPIFAPEDIVDGVVNVDKYLINGQYLFNCIMIRVPDSPSKSSAQVAYFNMFPNTPSLKTIVNYLKTAKLEPYQNNDDPFNPGGGTEVGGGGGDFDNTSVPVDIPNLPTISASSTGFISLFNPTLQQLNELASYLWSDLFEINGWKKLFADPMDAILGLSILPVAIPSGGTREVKVGNIGTGISLTIAASQFVRVDCGSIDVNEYWGAYLDYEPYTQAQIFLPYIGTRPISVDEIMGKTVRVVYHVDILTGACCCFVKCGDSVLYTYNGQCSIPIPITGANYTSVVNGILSIAGSAAALVATGGQAAPLIAAGAAAGAKKSAIAKGAAAKAQLTNAQIETGSNVASNVANQMKPQIAKSGSISGGAGLLNMQTPYLILIRPRQALPSKQNEFIGYPSLITVQLTELTGYTEVQSIHLENIPATSQELDEIEGLLKGGVIF